MSTPVVPTPPKKVNRINLEPATYRGAKTTLESSMAKLYASEVGVWIADRALQIFGGYGYVKDFPAEKYYRDMKLCTIGEGTSEIQRLVIAREILKAV